VHGSNAITVSNRLVVKSLKNFPQMIERQMIIGRCTPCFNCISIATKNQPWFAQVFLLRFPTYPTNNNGNPIEQTSRKNNSQILTFLFSPCSDIRNLDSVILRDVTRSSHQ